MKIWGQEVGTEGWLCPVIVGHVLGEDWGLCNLEAVYLVMGTMLCRGHATRSKWLEPSKTKVCTATTHVTIAGMNRCLCGASLRE